MSAHRDTSQQISFYYGNAARDLAHMLPKDDYVPEAKPTSADFDSLLKLVDEATTKLDTINHHRRELGFLLADLKRMIS
jgi:hypothetical protein